MISDTLYKAYKNDTNIYTYWLVNTSDIIKRRLNRNRQSEDQPKHELRNSKEISTKEFVSLTKFIAENEESSVPAFVYRCLKSAIKKRTSAGELYEAHAATADSDELIESNDSHQAFIYVLKRCYNILKGPEWEKKNRVAVKVSIEEVEQYVQGRYNLLKDEAAAVSGDEPPPEPESEPATVPTGVSKSARRRKNKKKTKAKDDTKRVQRQDRYTPIPFEEIGITDDGDSYLLAAYSAVQQWIELRRFVQDTWSQVAYNGVNGAAAAGVSKVAFCMMNKTSSEMLVQFPEKSPSYLTLINTLTGGGIDKAQGRFQLEASKPEEKTNPRVVSDIKEQFLWNMYEILKEFLKDFRQHRTGKPTNPIKESYATWDPNFDLEAASVEERLTWRRNYTIQWLYDLVNVTSMPKILRNKKRDKRDRKELHRINWSAGNEALNDRTIFGLNEFAGEITTLAMQEPSTNIEERIHPHIVFQLQCIVDSFTVYRGWYIPADAEHRMRNPTKSSVTRDVDRFMDRDEERSLGGFPASYQHLWYEIRTSCRDAPGLAAIQEDCDMTFLHFAKYLGSHVYSKGADPRLERNLRDWFKDSNNKEYHFGNEYKNTESSQFAKHTAHGLQQYSPFLCGAGLEEALSLSYKQMMYLWQQMREPTLIIRLYRYLKVVRIVTHRIPFWESLEILFDKCFLTQEERETQKMPNPGIRTLDMLQELYHTPSGTRHMHVGTDLHDFWDVTKLNRFNLESTMTAYRNAGWDWVKVIDEGTRPREDALILRLAGKRSIWANQEDWDNRMEVPRENDGGRVREPKKTEEQGGDTSAKVSGAASAKKVTETGPSTSTAGPSRSRADPQTPTPDSPRPDREGQPASQEEGVTEYKLLKGIREDFIDDVSGFDNGRFNPNKPLIGLNHPRLTLTILQTFARTEASLKAEPERTRNRLYQVYFEDKHITEKQAIKLANNEVSRRGSLFGIALDRSTTAYRPALDVLDVLADELDRENRFMWRFTFWNDVSKGQRIAEIKDALEAEEKYRKAQEEEAKKKASGSG